MRDASRCLVLGAAGFVGSHLCDALVEQGCEVLGVDNLATGRRANIEHLIVGGRLVLVHHDVTLPLPDLGRFDHVFCLASAASPADYHRLPIETLRAGALGTEHGVQLALEQGARFVLASTSEVYGDPDVHPQVESYAGRVNPVGPRSVYDEAKRYAEALTAAYRRSLGADTAIARIFNTYGPRMRADDGRMVPTFVGQALDGQAMTVSGSGRQTRSLCYVTDTVAGLIALAGSGEAGPVNIGNPVEQTVLEIAERIATLAGSGAGVRFVDAVEDDPRQRCPDIGAARRLLGWEPAVTADDGLDRTIAWFRAERRQHRDGRPSAPGPVRPDPRRPDPNQSGPEPIAVLRR